MIYSLVQRYCSSSMLTEAIHYYLDFMRGISKGDQEPTGQEVTTKVDQALKYLEMPL